MKKTIYFYLTFIILKSSLSLAGTISITDYGADPLSGDNTTAIQNAINAAIQSGDTLYIPCTSNGCVYITRTVNIQDNLRIVGDIGSTLKLKNDTSSNLMNIYGTNLNIIIYNITFDGNYTRQGVTNSGNIIYVNLKSTNSAKSHISFYRCSFINQSFSSINFWRDSDYTNYPGDVILTVFESKFINGRDHATNSYVPRFISVVDGGILVVTNSFFDLGIDIDLNNVGMPAITSVNSASYWTDRLPNKLIIKNNYFNRLGRGNADAMLGVVDLYARAEDSIIENNVFNKSNSRVISVKSNSSNVIIRGNNIINTNRAGCILVEPVSQAPYTNGKNFVIEGNICKDITGYGILVNGYETTSDNDFLKNVNISANIVENIYKSGTSWGSGIVAIDVRDININNNTVKYLEAHGLWGYKTRGTINISNNSVTGSSSYGIYLSSGLNNSIINIANNIVDSAYAFGIIIDSSSGNLSNEVKISNNSVNNVQYYGGYQYCYRSSYSNLFILHNNSCINSGTNYFQQFGNTTVKVNDNSWQ